MKIDPRKWQDEDWDVEDDIPETHIGYREKVVRDNKKNSIRKKRKEKMRLRENEASYFVKEIESNTVNEEGYPNIVRTWEEEV